MSASRGKGNRRPSCPWPLLTKMLSSIIHITARQIHPSVFHDIVRGVGAEQGRLAAVEWRQRHDLARRCDTRGYVQCLKAVAEQSGWILGVAIESDDLLRITVRESLYTELHETGSYLCELAAGLFTGVTTEMLGDAQVYVGQCSETPPLNCAFVIHLGESTASEAIPAGPHPPRIDTPSALRRERVPRGTLGERLTGRELQILRLIAQGLSDKAIAEALRLSVRTVENHGARIRQKLAISSRTGLVRFAFRARLVEP